jgi:Tfp pilus assembly protein PilF
MNAQKLPEALALFKINVDLFPRSFNVYDSIAEAYMNNGDNKLAIENYRKSLELNPKNDNAVTMLKKLEGKGK